MQTSRRQPGHSSVLFLAALTLGLSVACSKPKPTAEGAAGVAEEGAASTPSASSFELQDETPNLLLTWLDEQGDFHVVQTIAEVPEAGRAQVRVVSTTADQGVGKTVLVADLRSKDPQGRYSVVSMDRAQWNELGAEKRKVRMEALAPKAPPPDATTPNTATSNATDGKVRAVIYGASWCKPCHDAEAFLKKLGVDVVKKDIEESRAAQAEMQQKLTRAGRGGASIPVIEVAGQLFVGFDRRSLTAAVEQARKGDKTSKL